MNENVCAHGWCIVGGCDLCTATVEALQKQAAALERQAEALELSALCAYMTPILQRGEEPYLEDSDAAAALAKKIARASRHAGKEQT